ARVADSVPATGPVVWAGHLVGQEVGDVALVPDVTGLLHRPPVPPAVARLLVAALEVADDAPAPVEVDPARRPLREPHDEDVEPRLRVGVHEVAHRATLVWVAGAGRQRIAVDQQGGHGGPD